ncbi:topoisomerase II [Streptomyces sp. NPDC000594]|uniref:topoisomerase II n=1 Tax=Streptomyces sp. NPDC000594 TaxID=3154261 RepID=UPI003329419A
MSHDQPGPYGGPPQQPGAYGQPGPYGPPGPYGGQGEGQAGYGHPHQDGPGYGHPQQGEPGYGHPQQGGPGYGYPQQAPPGVPPQGTENPYAQPGPYDRPEQPGAYAPPEQGPYAPPEQGPYAPPQQPGPYGQPQPGPYGQPDGPGGYPPPQQPGQWGSPQQPGQPGAPVHQAYPGQPPVPPRGGGKKKTALIIGASVVALAVVATGAVLLLGNGDGDGGDSGVSAATKGYKLTPPATVGDFKRGELRSGATMSDEDRKEAEKIGVKDPQEVQAEYKAGSDAEPLKQRMMMVNGVWGEIGNPAEAIDAYFAAAREGAAGSDGKTEVELLGTARSVSPKGLDGALMKCQEAKFTPKDDSGPMPKNWQVPICIWADHSTVTAVIGIDVASVLGGDSTFTEAKVAELATELYRTGRTKV